MKHRKLCLVFALIASWVGLGSPSPSLEYASRLGGSGMTQATAIARDADENVYIAGSTTATNLATSGAFQTSFPGTQAAFVAEFNSKGGLVFLTYLGGSGSQYGQGIAVDDAGHIFVVGGTSSTNFPVVKALQSTNAGGYDAFLAELAPGGSNLVFSTYLGGADVDTANSIALAPGGLPIIAGYTQSTNLPVVNAFQTAYRGNGDAFVAKLDPAQPAWLYTTYLGGTSYENGPGFVIRGQTALIPTTGGAVAAGLDGSAYVTGWTSSTNYPVTNAFQAVPNFSYSGATATVVTKLDPNGQPVFSTYFGGQVHDVGYAIGVDGAANVYFAGSFASADLPVAHAFQSQFTGSRCGYLAALDPTGTNLVYCTYLGGHGAQQVNGLSVRPAGALVLVGMTTAPYFPLAAAVRTNGPTGIAVSTNAGNTWTLSPRLPDNSTAQALAFDPFDANTIYAIGSALYRSKDRGAHWTLINNEITGGLNYSKQGLLALHPHTAGTLYYGAYQGVYKSTDGGDTWTLLANGLPSAPNLLALALDPKVPDTMYAGTYSEGVFKSVDGGKIWTAQNAGLNNKTVRALLVDPANPANVLAGLNNDFSTALYKGSNGGTNWSVVPGLPSYTEPVVALAANPGSPANLYAILGDFFANAVLMESTNSGASWSQSLQLLGGMMNAVSVVPAPAPSLALAVSETTATLSWPAAFDGFGLQVTPTLDPPQWQKTGAPAATDGNYYTVVIPTGSGQGYYRLIATNTAPRQPYVYVGCDQDSLQGLLLSRDGGTTWEAAGLAGDAVLAVAADPRNPDALIVGAQKYDTFVASFDAAGQMVTSTFLGGSGLDAGNAVVLGASDAVVAGVTTSPDFPVTPTGLARPRFLVGLPGATSPGKRPVFRPPDAADLLVYALNSLMPCPKSGTVELQLAWNKPLTEFEIGAEAFKCVATSVSGNLPTGTAFTMKPGYFEYPTLSGRPNVVGTYTFTVKYHLDPGCDWTKTYKIVVK